MLDADYVDAKEEKSVVAIRPKSAFRPLFEIAPNREGGDVALITTTPPELFSREASIWCSWWRRGRVELPVQKVFPQGYYRFSRLLSLPLADLNRRGFYQASRWILSSSYRHMSCSTSNEWHPFSASEDSLRWADYLILGSLG